MNTNEDYGTFVSANKYGVSKFLDISTAHITQETLNTHNFYKISSYPEGAFFWVPSIFCDYPVPDDLKVIFEYARKNECIIVRFDADGFLFPEFPEYDWE